MTTAARRSFSDVDWEAQQDDPYANWPSWCNRCNCEHPTKRCPAEPSGSDDNGTSVQPIDIFGDTSLAGSPELPLEALPHVVARFAADESKRLGVDHALIAIPALAVCAAALHDGYRVQPRKHDTGWTEAARLWVACVAEPGERKSPALAKAIAPLRKAELRWIDADQGALRRYDLELRQHKRKLEAFVRDGNGAPPDEPRRPAVRRRVVDDITIESLADILVDNASGVLCVQDELSGWFGSFDAYRAGATGKDRGLWLEAWNGGPKPIDRIKGRTLVKNLSVSMLGGIQPGPMRRLVGKVNDDGLIQRFLVFFPRPCGAGVDCPPDAVAGDAYRLTVFRLVDLTVPTGGKIYTLTAEAHKERKAVDLVCRNVMLLPDTSGAFKAHLAKWEGYFARLLLTFHVVEAVSRDDEPADVIEGDTAARVAKLMVGYLLPHAARFYGELLGEDHLNHARWVAGHIIAHNLEHITARDIGRAYRELRGDAKKIAATMDTLTLAGWVTPSASNRPGAPLSRWSVNGAVHEVFTRRAEQERTRREETRRQIAEAVKNLAAVNGENR